LDDAIELSIASLNAYGPQYRHWSIAYSGGKDSSATVAFVVWAIRKKLVNPPESLTVLYADTRMELPPLQENALSLLETLRTQGVKTQVVLPEMDKRFYVYMLGYGVPPPKNRFRWCTPMIKVQPMLAALEHLRQDSGEKLLMITGVRLGESEIRDQRIALSCSRDDGECGQGWFQISTPESIADTLAPLVHWRLCHVYDWLYFHQDRHEFDLSAIAAVYGDGDIRTGCIGCNLVDRDTALQRLIQKPDWSHLAPLLEIKPLYRELIKPTRRKRKACPEKRQDGRWSVNVQRMGPLTMKARQCGLKTVLDIQNRAGTCLINEEEAARIREMWALDMWPRRWSADDIDATEPVDALFLDNGKIIRQALLI
jgi:DNA sulfur modification protein DndC